MGVIAKLAETARIDAGPVDQFALNKFHIIEAPGGSIGVVRTQNGFFAVSNRCPHMGGPVCVGTDVTSTTVSSKPFEYSLDHEHAVVRCPWHRWEFRVDTGENIGKITRGRLMTYEVEVDGQHVYVHGRNRRGAPAATLSGDEQ